MNPNPAFKLGTSAADLIDTFLKSNGLNKPPSISKHPQIPKEFPGNWSESQINYWVGVYNSISNGQIGGEVCGFWFGKCYWTGCDDGGIESVIRNGV